MLMYTVTPQGYQQVDPSQLPALLGDSANTLWIDMTGPTDEDVRVMQEVFKFHPLAIEDTHNQEQHPKIEEYADHLFVIVNPVAFHRRSPDFRELDVFVGRNYLVTVHQAAEPVIDQVCQRLNRGASLPMSSGFLLYVVLDTVVDGYFPVIDALEERINDVENAVLVGARRDSDTLNQLFSLKRGLAVLWRGVWPQRDLLSKLTHHDLGVIDYRALQYYLRDVSDHLLWIADTINTFRDTLTSITDLHLSVVSNRLNRIVNRLTIFTLMIGALTVITGFYGMNFETNWPPFKESGPIGVLFVLGVMIASTVVLLMILRRMKLY